MPAPERSNLAYRNVARLVRPLMFSMTKPEWRGVEHLPRDRGFIVAANHMTMIDPLTFAHFLYDNGFPPRILAKASLWGVPVLGPILRATGQVPVHRNSSEAGRSLAEAVSAIADGECVAVFPEGTLTRDPDLWPMAGKTGIARLALLTRAPVIPVAQWGAQDVLGRYAKVLKPVPRKKVTIVAGPPVDLADLYDRPHDTATLREATERVMVAITAILEEIRGETAPAERFDMRRAAGGPIAADPIAADPIAAAPVVPGPGGTTAATTDGTPAASTDDATTAGSDGPPDGSPGGAAGAGEATA